VYPRLSERLGVKDHVMVLNIMLQKIAVNLKAFASCEDVISHTLNLFQACTLPVTKKVCHCAVIIPICHSRLHHACSDGRMLPFV
jgi:hypothetical protein